MTNDSLKQMKMNILIWYFSFFPLIVCSVLFVLYFIFDTSYLYYFSMIFTFSLFVVLYVFANRRITCKDGYTLVNAISFYKKCVKLNITKISNEDAFNYKLMDLATSFEYSLNLNLEQLHQLYSIGRELSEK